MNRAIQLERSDMALVRFEFGRVPQKVALPPGQARKSRSCRSLRIAAT